jgi:hypothetical protein
MRRLSYVYENLHDVHKKCGLWSSDDYKVKEYRQHVKNIYTLIRTYQSYVNATTAGYDFPFPVDIKLFDEVLLSESVKSTVYNVENKFEHLLIDNNKMVYYHDGHLYIDIPPYTTQPIVGKMSHQEMISAWADINDFSLKEYYTTPWDTISVSYKDEKKNLLRTDYFYVQKNNESAVKVRKVGITRISLYVGEQNKFHWLGSSSFIEGVD